MTVALTLIVKNEAETLPRTLPSYLGLIDSYVIVDTGSTDGTQDVARSLLPIPGRVIEHEWVDFSTARNAALSAARGTADWLLMPDADMTATVHPGLRTFLEEDRDPTIDAYLIEVVEGNIWQKPLLLRGDQEWLYRMPVHEYLDTAGRNCRLLHGLSLHHSRPGSVPGKYDGYARLLIPDAEKGDPRATFYLAESLRFGGRIDEALEMYRLRADLNGYVEERWYSAYMIAKLTDDVAGLIECWESRPWRHEPLTAAARIVAAQGASTDMLFLEPSP